MNFIPFLASFQAAGAEAQAIAQIEKSGGSVRQIAQNDDRREVDFHLQGASVNDAQIAPVASLKKVVALNLGKTSVTDAGLVHLKALTGLAELHLENTRITDKGLAQVKPLKDLTYLNVYGTAVTDAGLDQLSGLANLKSLFVWQTRVTPAGVEKLKKALPKLDIVTGWDLERKEPEKPKETKQP